jgi:hypothetical protein
MARKRRLTPTGWVVDMRHYLDEETGELPNAIPERALNLAIFLGAIVAWVTDHLPDDDEHTNVPCRRSTGRRRCRGENHRPPGPHVRTYRVALSAVRRQRTYSWLGRYVVEPPAPNGREAAVSCRHALTRRVDIHYQGDHPASSGFRAGATAAPHWVDLVEPRCEQSDPNSTTCAARVIREWSRPLTRPLRCRTCPARIPELPCQPFAAGSYVPLSLAHLSMDLGR